MLSPNVYVLALSFREMVPSFLSGGGVENGHNLLNFGEQGSQTRQAIYVVITREKQSKDTRSLWMMSLLKQHHQYPSNHVSFCTYIFRIVGDVSLQVCLHNFSLHKLYKDHWKICMQFFETHNYVGSYWFLDMELYFGKGTTGGGNVLRSIP